MKWRIVVIKFQMEENSVGSLLCNKGIYTYLKPFICTDSVMSVKQLLCVK